MSKFCIKLSKKAPITSWEKWWVINAETNELLFGFESYNSAKKFLKDYTEEDLNRILPAPAFMVGGKIYRQFF